MRRLLWRPDLSKPGTFASTSELAAICQERVICSMLIVWTELRHQNTLRMSISKQDIGVICLLIMPPPPKLAVRVLRERVHRRLTKQDHTAGVFDPPEPPAHHASRIQVRCESDIKVVAAIVPVAGAPRIVNSLGPS